MALVMQSGARLPSSLERRIPGVHIRENRLRKYARFMHQYRALAHAPTLLSRSSLCPFPSFLSAPTRPYCPDASEREREERSDTRERERERERHRAFFEGKRDVREAVWGGEGIG